MLPVSTCKAERFFSKFNIMCSAQRSIISEERLEVLFMQVYRNELPKTEDVINFFFLSEKLGD